MLRSLCRRRSAGDVVPLFPPPGNSVTTVLYRWLALTSCEEIGGLVDSSLRFFRWSSLTVTAILYRSFENKVEWRLERFRFLAVTDDVRDRLTYLSKPALFCIFRSFFCSDVEWKRISFYSISINDQIERWRTRIDVFTATLFGKLMGCFHSMA